MTFNLIRIDCYGKILLVIGYIFLCINTAVAAQYYVSTNGNNSNSGLYLNDTWKNPSFAVANAQAGDTIYLLNGTWNKEYITFSKSGNPSEKIVLKAYNGTPVLDGLDMTGDAIRVWGVSYVDIQGIDIQRYKRMINIHNASYITVDNCSLHDTNTGSIFQFDRGVSYSSITNSEIYNQSGGFNALEISGNTIECGEDTHDIKIINNHIHHVTGHNAINFAAKYNPVHERVIWNITVSNNSIHNIFNNSYSIATNVITLYDSIFSGNIIYNAQRGISIYSDNVTFVDNIVYNVDTLPELGNIGGISYNATFIRNNANLELNSIKSTIIEPLKDIRINGNGSWAYIYNSKNNQKITMTTKSNIEFIQTDNSIFIVDKTFGLNLYEKSPVRCFPEKSNSSIKLLTDIATVFNIKKLPISFIPSIGYLDIKIENESSFSVSSSVLENPTYININSSNIANKKLKLYVDGTLFDEKISDSNGFASFYYYNINGTEWNTNHTFYIEYNTSEITTSQEPNEIYFNSFSIIPSSNHVGPREYFTIDINIDPVVPVNSARFNVRYDSARTSASDVAPGGLFRGNGVLFDTGVIDNNAGMITGIYGNRYIAPIYGPGTAVIVTMQAGNDTGVLDIALDDIGIVNESAVPLPYTAHAASVLVDTPPEIGPMGPMSVVELEELAFDIPAYDADGDTLIYSSAALPSGASLDSQTGAFTWTPLRGQAGSYTIDFSVSDGHLNDSCSMDIEVLPANDPPVITSFEPQNGTEHMEGRPIEISVQAVDADDDQLTYSIMIDGVSMSDTPSYTWVTDYSSAGEHVIEVAVSDGTHTVTAMRTITVLDVRPRMEIPALPRDGSGTGTSHAF